MPTSRHSLAALLAAAILLASGTAFGQAAPAPAAPPQPKCEKPGDPPSVGSSEMGKAAQEAKRTKWNTAMKAYIECIKKFAEEEQALASPHIKAANAAVEEYNRAIKVFNDSLDAYK